MILTHVLSSYQNKFEMDIQAMPVRKACTQMLKGAIRQQRYRLKQKYFNPFPLNLVTKTSPVCSMTDEQWNELVESWKGPKKMVHFFLETNNILVLPTTLSCQIQRRKKIETISMYISNLLLFLVLKYRTQHSTISCISQQHQNWMVLTHYS